MRRSSIILFSFIFLLFFFICKDSLSDSILTVPSVTLSSEEAFLIYKKYLSCGNIIINVDKINNEFQFLKKINKIILINDYSLNDLIVYLSKLEEYKLKREKVQSQYRWLKEIFLPRKGNYEIYFEFYKKLNGMWRIKSEKEITKWIFLKEKGNKFIKIGELQVNDNRNKRIKIIFTPFLNTDKDKIKILLVDKKRKEKIKHLFWTKIKRGNLKIVYIFVNEKEEFYIP